MTEWNNCEVCGCRYALTLINGKPIDENARCPADEKNIVQFRSENDKWRQRILKHHPEYESLD